ncbi:uncharacterized protein Z519_12730 [Cladophialophora bantiana CBS 173.52]|uniref:Uncharacterized protein n=1 Tax=Cladophialophora bantiana (strain ATCC 10958 / CBS 173.52 / CDC B-1940 / NIH 8579) TaxID=1442370 RepID=A0A0D2H726_CLAB1|nr:uncharacterized protein Z519_12730 [Cladophialophora bantiana CBS 173.52]KIW86675.1 hypothetical protein Z519_12730 [Cladophialophora bantiana CBS 173.52]
MSSPYQFADEPLIIDTQLPELAPSESSDSGNNLSFLDLDCTDPSSLSFNPFECSTFESESINFAAELQQSVSQELIPDTGVINQLNELNFLYAKLEQRVNELDTMCAKLQNQLHQQSNLQSRLSSVETHLKQLVDWYFGFKTTVNRNTEKVALEISSLKLRKTFF